MTSDHTGAASPLLLPCRALGADVPIQVDYSRDELLTPFSKATLTDRYLQKEKGETFQGLFARVAAWNATDADHAQRLYDAISKHWLMPSTPILSNSGTNRGFPISCFLNSVEDSLEGIFGTLLENNWLSARGGGIGTSWSNVRSIDEKIRGVGTTSGVIPFIKMQDSATFAVSQGDLRRGSSAAYLHVRHPEIEEFVDVRREEGDLARKSLNVHHGVVVPDEFMEAVRDDADWELRSPKTGEVRKIIKARQLWFKILQARIETGEPYILWIDQVREARPDIYKKLGLEVVQSNLCIEIMLTTGRDHRGQNRTAVCDLASLVMDTMDEWHGNVQFLEDALMFLDNVLQDFIDRTAGVKGFENARYSAHRERSIGLGFMGFHSYLQSKGIAYESAMAESVNRRLWKWLGDAAKGVNTRMAMKHGACPDAQDAGVAKRWTHMFSVAPTASISIIAGCTSPAGEPFPANAYAQKTLSGSFTVRNKHLDKAIRDYAQAHVPAKSIEDWVDEVWISVVTNKGSAQHLEFLTEDQRHVFRTSFEMDQRWIINHAAARQPWVCQGQSVNLFLPADIHKKNLHDIHWYAWSIGLKSLYYCRSLSKIRADVVPHIAGEMPKPVMKPEEFEDVTFSKGECLSCQ